MLCLTNSLKLFKHQVNTKADQNNLETANLKSDINRLNNDTKVLNNSLRDLNHAYQMASIEAQNSKMENQGVLKKIRIQSEQIQQKLLNTLLRPINVNQV